MRIAILVLLACCLAGCETDDATYTLTPADIANGLPDPASRLTSVQIGQLRNRLDQLKVGMSRAKVLEILNLSSFNVKMYQYQNVWGIRYHIQHEHKLEVALDAGDYDSTLRWARFDGELWPQHGAQKKAAPATAP